jgi:hypothetical protein
MADGGTKAEAAAIFIDRWSDVAGEESTDRRCLFFNTPVSAAIPRVSALGGRQGRCVLDCRTTWKGR